MVNAPRRKNGTASSLYSDLASSVSSCSASFPSLQEAGRGGAAQRVSFAACGAARDAELATTRAEGKEKNLYFVKSVFCFLFSVGLYLLRKRCNKYHALL